MEGPGTVEEGSRNDGGMLEEDRVGSRSASANDTRFAFPAKVGPKISDQTTKIFGQRVHATERQDFDSHSEAQRSDPQD